MYIQSVKEHKAEMIKKEFARLGRICDVVRVTGYGLTTVKCVVRGCYRTVPDPDEPAMHNTCDMDLYPQKENEDSETFGSLQYIIDKLSQEKQLILTETLVHGTSQAEIGKMISKSQQAICQILKRIIRELQKTAPKYEHTRLDIHLPAEGTRQINHEYHE